MPEFNSPEFEESLDIKNLIRSFRKHKILIFFTILLVFVLTLYRVYSATPRYQAATIILAEEENPTEMYLQFEFAIGETYLNDQVEILSSRSLAEKVIQYLWESPYKDKLYALGTRFYIPPTENISYWLKKVITFGLYEPEQQTPTDTNRPIPNNMLHKYSQRLRNKTQVSFKRNTNTISISYSCPDPIEVAYITNLIFELYLQTQKDWKSDEIINLKEFIEKQVGKITAELNEAENRLQQFQEIEGVYTIEANSERILGELTSFESAYETTIAEVNVLETELEHVKKLLGESENKLIDDIINTTDPRIRQLRQRLAELEAEKIKTLIDIGMDENNRAILQIQSNIDNLKENLVTETEALLISGIPLENPINFSQGLQTKIIELNSEILQLKAKARELNLIKDKYSSEVQGLPEKTKTLARLLRERQVKENLFLFLSQKLEETRITEAQQTIQTRVLDKAIPPDNPTSLNRNLLLLLSLVIGAGLGLAGGLFIDHLDNTVRTIESIQKYGLTVIGIIPKIEERYQSRKQQIGASIFGGKKKKVTTSRKTIARFSERLVTHLEPKSPIAEAYRSIRTNLTYALPDKEIKSLIVTSPSAGEGKSTTVVNLAITFAQLGKKTILIDTDLRKPVMQYIFGLTREPGITDYLVGYEGIEEFGSIVRETEIDNLYVVTSGKLFPNPSELLGSNKMKYLIDQLVKEWDMVLFDSPPIMPVTDSRLLSKSVDGLVLVAKSGETEMMALERAVSMVNSVKSPILGCILNGFTKRDSYYYSDYQYYYYYEYYDSSESS
ncbi:MAG: polysaccharide biosynthesis tyrosine autokinase [Candidatus Marinimicrobia bacterium]|nr:polysaccharide biosynthesis tyrosine autokinase [Candidatus Neomarinimicrobiota bacterium]